MRGTKYIKSPTLTNRNDCRLQLKLIDINNTSCADEKIHKRLVPLSFILYFDTELVALKLG